MKYTFAALFVLGLAGCSVQQNDGVMKAEKRTSGFMGLSTNADIEVDTPKAFAGKKEVIIGGFKVGFNESKKLQKKARGSFLGGGFGGQSTGLVKLEGVNEATKQQIANDAYNDFIAELKAKGYTVLSQNQFTSSAAYADGKKYQFPYEVDDSGFMSSYGVARYYSPKALGNEQLMYMGEIPGVTGGFGFSNGSGAASKFADEQKIPVIYASYFVDFAGAGGHESVTTSSVEVGQLLSVDQGMVGIIGGYSGSFSTTVGSLKLGQPIASDKEFATIEKTSSDVDVGVETAVNVASALLGGGTNQSREFVFHADSSKYKAAATDALQKANDMMIEKMATLK